MNYLIPKKFIFGLLILVMLFALTSCKKSDSNNSPVITDQQFLKNPISLPAGFTIPLIDLADQNHHQIIVDKEPGQYLGHPTTVLLEDNKTIIAVYPKGHGRGGDCDEKKHRWRIDLERPAAHP